MAAARSASMRGVSRLDGSLPKFARKILRFRDDAPAREALIRIGARGFLPAGQRGSFDFVPRLFVGLVFVGIEIRQDHSLHDGLRRRRPFVRSRAPEKRRSSPGESSAYAPP